MHVFSSIIVIGLLRVCLMHGTVPRFKGHRQWIFLLPCFVLYNCLSQDMYFICDENISICSKERMNLV